MILIGWLVGFPTRAFSEPTPIFTPKYSKEPLLIASLTPKAILPVTTSTFVNTTEPSSTPIPFFGRVNTEGGGIILREKPGGSAISTLTNGHLVQMLPETQVLNGVTWRYVLIKGPTTDIYGWVVHSAIETAIPLATDIHPITYTPWPTNTLQITSTTTLSIGSTQVGKDGVVLLYVPAGPFTMGSDKGNKDEQPVHTVTLDAFWIDRTEVSNAMYKLCVQEGFCQPPIKNGSDFRSSYFDNAVYENYPVIYMTWEQSNVYCEWAGGRLPTEAEWEKAARGTGGRIYPWGDTPPDAGRANFSGMYNNDTFPVSDFPAGASPYGALNMAGNVWEWVADWYDVYPGGDANASPNFGTKYKILRGGSKLNSDNYIRSALRYAVFSAGSIPESKYFGFRCAQSATP